jgi:hypothetical protein
MGPLSVKRTSGQTAGKAHWPQGSRRMPRPGRRKAPGALVAAVADEPAHRPRLHTGSRPRSGGKRSLSSSGARGWSPIQRGMVSCRQDDGHPVVDPGDELVGLGRQDAVGLGQIVPGRIPDSGKREGLLAREREEVGQLHPAARLPFVESVRRHEASPLRRPPSGMPGTSLRSRTARSRGAAAGASPAPQRAPAPPHRAHGRPVPAHATTGIVSVRVTL